MGKKKKLFTVYFAVAEKYCLFNWMIKSQPDGSFTFCLFSLLIGRGELQKRICLIFFSAKMELLFSVSGFHSPFSSWDVSFWAHLSAACLKEATLLKKKNLVLYTRSAFLIPSFSFPSNPAGTSRHPTRALFVTTSCRCSANVIVVLIEHVAHDDYS